VEAAVNQAFAEHVANNHIYDSLSLINLLISGMENTAVRSGVLLSLLENCFECLSIDHLCKVITALYENVGKLSSLGVTETFKLHRLLNLGLRRVPYSNPINRGQMHFILSHIVNFPHESGLATKDHSAKLPERCLTK
jgi:hypothetical protein